LKHRCISSAHQPKGMCFNLDLKASFHHFVEPGNLRDDDGVVQNIDYNSCELQVWDQIDVGEEKLFKKSGIKRKMRCFYLDIPNLHKNSHDSYNFIEAL
jgi:hypothetical protein